MQQVGGRLLENLAQIFNVAIERVGAVFIYTHCSGLTAEYSHDDKSQPAQQIEKRKPSAFFHIMQTAYRHQQRQNQPKDIRKDK